MQVSVVQFRPWAPSYSSQSFAVVRHGEKTSIIPELVLRRPPCSFVGSRADCWYFVGIDSYLRVRYQHAYRHPHTQRQAHQAAREAIRWRWAASADPTARQQTLARLLSI